jgi:pyruvate dehydrogenase E1 component beta subunit
MNATMTYAQAFREGILEEMERDDRIFILGTDLFRRGGAFFHTKGFGDIFGPERIRDTPISESAITAAAVGAALNGMRPIAELSFIDVSFGAMDEIINQAAKYRYMLGVPVPVVLRLSIGAARYGAQHNNGVEAWFPHTPGLLVVMPATPFDAKGMIKTALRGDDPVMFLMHKRLGGVRGEVGGPDDLVPYGVGHVARVGADLTIVAYSISVGMAQKAADELAAVGVDAEVIDLRSLMPLDYELIEASVRKTGRVVLVSESPRFGGYMAEVAATIQEDVFDYLDAPIQRVGALHTPIPHSPAMLDAVIPQVSDIVRAANIAMGR